MPADGRWDLTRRLKGKYTLYIILPSIPSSFHSLLSSPMFPERNRLFGKPFV